MKYPRLSPELDRRRKLMPEDIKNIRHERERGRSTIYLANKYEVSATLIAYWTNEKFRQKVIQSSKHQKKDMKRHKELDAESKKYIAKVNPLFKEYQKEQGKKYYNRHKK